jgi:hypothetical protein
VAQTKKKRRRKHRGTQGGRIDNKSRARPRSRQEAKAQARSRRGGAGAQRNDSPPTWRGSAIRGIAAALIFLVVLLLLFKQPAGPALALSALMLVFYIPAGYYIDQTMWRKRERARMRSREKS